MRQLPLADIRVLDLTIARAGPTAVRQLADWGANVVRIEPPPKPDAAPGIESAWHSPDYLNLHRNKRALTLDLKTDEGREILDRLVEGADVLVENMRVPVKYRLGIDYARLEGINPRLVMGSISGFGQEGPYAERGGVDQIAQGLGGLMSITGLPGQGPVRVGVPIADLSAGLYLALGILLALHERERTGRGRWVHTSLLEAMIAMLDFQAARWTVAGEVPPQAGNHHPTGIPMGAFRTKDGYINIAGPGGRLYRSFCEVIGAPELIDDARFASAALRSKNRDVLNQLIAERLETRTSAEWIAELNTRGVPCGPVNRIDETFADPQVRHLEMEQQVEHQTLGEISIVRNALNMEGLPSAIRSASPDRGQHTDEILGELGYDERRRAELRERGVI